VHLIVSIARIDLASAGWVEGKVVHHTRVLSIRCEGRRDGEKKRRAMEERRNGNSPESARLAGA